LSAEISAAPASPASRRRELRVPAPEVHRPRTADGVELRLTRHRGGAAGPVLLVHCIGVSSSMYTLDTIETNLLEYLVENGFDVWLLDYRLSIQLPASADSCSFDQVGAQDFPAAVDAIRRETGAASIQVVAHGVGGQTLAMAMLGGLEGVRSAVFSQVCAHLRAPRMNRFKAGLNIPGVLRALGAERMTAYVAPEPDLPARLYNLALRLQPIQAEERCESDVCHRITAMYGPLYEHDRLNAATHATLAEHFGRANLRAFQHLTRNLRTGHIVGEDGEERYLPYPERLAIPIAFIHGADNDCLLPESTRLSYEWLRERNGDLYSWNLIPGYGHVDCIIGAEAARHVYPIILRHLQAN
jgi:cholesterol oxidase